MEGRKVRAGESTKSTERGEKDIRSLVETKGPMYTIRVAERGRFPPRRNSVVVGTLREN